MINLHEDFHVIGGIAENDGFVHICSLVTDEPHEISKADFLEYYEIMSADDNVYKMKDEYTQAVL